MKTNFNKESIKQTSVKENPLEKRERLKKESMQEQAAKPNKEVKYKSARIYPDDAKTLRRMAAKHDTTVVQLVHEAVNDLERKYKQK